MATAWPYPPPLAPPLTRFTAYPYRVSGDCQRAGARWMAVDIYVNGGRVGPSDRAFWYGAITNKILFFKNKCYKTQTSPRVA